jgi:hypothetical protein
VGRRLDQTKCAQSAGAGLRGRARDFSTYVADALGFAREVLGWNPDPKQQEVLQALYCRRMLLNWGRQSGKTEVLASRVVHWVATHPGELVLIVGGVESHVKTLMNRVDHYLGVMDWPTRGQTGKRISRMLPNGSEIVGMTTNRSVRGNPASLVILDEAAHVSDDVWSGLLPTMAATRGSLIAASTPFGNTGQFYEIWHGKDTVAKNWVRSVYPATENPRIEPGFLDEMRLLKGQQYVRQEFLCEFVENGKNLLSRELIDKLYRLE